MKTINDMLTPKDGVLGKFQMYLNDTQKWFWDNRPNEGHKIEVQHSRDMGTDITVQSFYDGILDWCNHAGAKEGTVTQYAGYDSEYEAYGILCDKCDAWGDKDGGWYE
jgi:hypothetical protein